MSSKLQSNVRGPWSNQGANHLGQALLFKKRLLVSTLWTSMSHIYPYVSLKYAVVTDVWMTNPLYVLYLYIYIYIYIPIHNSVQVQNHLIMLCTSHVTKEVYQIGHPSSQIYRSRENPQKDAHAVKQCQILNYMMGQNLVPLVNIKIACKWVFIF